MCSLGTGNQKPFPAHLQCVLCNTQQNISLSSGLNLANAGMLMHKQISLNATPFTYLYTADGAL